MSTPIVEKYRIVGENATAAAFRQILRDSDSTASKIASGFKRAFGAISTAAIVGAFKQTVEFHDELGRGAIQSGIATKAYTELAFAARQNDVGHEALANSLKKMHVALSEANSGGKAQLATLRALGISLDGIRKLEPDRQFELIADQISRIQDPADRTRAAVELFGKSGAELLPMFSQGAEGIRKAREEAVRFGQSLDDIDLKKLQDADRAIKQMSESWRGAKTSFAAWAAQDFSEVADKMAVVFGTSSKIQDLEVRIRDLQREAAKGVPLYFNFGYIDGAPVVMGPEKLAEWIRILRIEQSKLQTGFGTGIRGGKPFAGTGGAITAPPGFLPDPAKPLKLKELKPDIIDWNELLRDTATDAQRAALAYDEFRAKIDLLKDTGFIDAAEFNKRLAGFHESGPLQEVEVTAKKIFLDANEGAKNLMTTLQDESARRAVGYISDAIMGLDDGAKSFAKGMIDAFRRILADQAAQDLMNWFKNLGKGGGGGGGLLGAIGSGLGWLFGGGSGGGGASGNIPGFAAGGFMPPGSWGMVGERGPELAFAGSQGATIVPLDRARGGGNYAPKVEIHNHVDARGASVELVKHLPRILAESNRQAVDQAEARIIERLQRRVYRL